MMVGMAGTRSRISRYAAPVAVSATTEPTDRSMPPMMITSSIPTARMPVSDTSRVTLLRLR